MNRNPDIIPTICPPITFLGCAVIFLGIAKTMKAVEPKAATITGVVMKSSITIKRMKVASRL